MMRPRRLWFTIGAFALLGLSAMAHHACGNGVEADERGIGAECATSEDCAVEIGAECLTQFKGGYCGLQGCTNSLDCPIGSGCVAHTDGMNYCFRICIDKLECNVNRTLDNESNCSSNVVYASGDKEGKACVPPSG